ncbi:redoxin [Formosa sp. Hel1_33_131]|jgi:peroxiredoxin|uniref:peroxiredoxin family protein n=1 Tax=Formosa sp. Hel1_33_131 TaxID=1336794 RepID=UPI00084E3604|nr:redoxin domain-containing protein [Formosa sp. Hel1_33_131]AOR27661.1 redoxin [Formosa sp. Hel1_33_131]
MFKKLIFFIVVIGVLGLLSYLGYNIIIKAKEKKAIAEQLQTIPEFEFFTLEQQPFTKADLKPNLNAIFIYFNSDCDFCHYEAQNISDNLDSFKNVQFVFVSTESIEVIQNFSKQYNFYNQQNITFLYDNNSLFSSQFDATSIPYVLIYDKNQELIKKHKGQLNVKGVLRALQQNE